MCVLLWEMALSCRCWRIFPGQLRFLMSFVPPLSSLRQRKRRIPIPIKTSSLRCLTAPIWVGVLLLWFMCVARRYLEVQRGTVTCSVEGKTPHSQAWLFLPVPCRQSWGTGAAACTERTWSISRFCRKMHMVILSWPRAHLQAGPFDLEVSAAVQELWGLHRFSMFLVLL